MNVSKMHAMMTLCAILFLFCAAPVQAAPREDVAETTRCPVCGMFVAKYDNWLSQILLADDSVLFFDGVKDLLVYYFQPEKYGKATRGDIREIWVKDYYTLEWIDGRQALYVIGSDVYGPMGKEFIPFAGRDAAQSFLQDHRGKEILVFEEITDDLVQSMRAGAKMHHGAK
jgi:copper chaperone NosL